MLASFASMETPTNTPRKDEPPDTIEWAPILDRLLDARSVVITSHVNPDGDALGSELALARWLATRQRPARIVNSDPVPQRYDFLDRTQKIETLDPATHADLATDSDLLVIVDVSRWDRIGRVGELFGRSERGRICIDHHPGSADFATAAEVIAPNRAATGELIFELIHKTSQSEN